MILELTTFLQLAATCAPGIAPETLAAIARVESGFNTLAIGVNESGGSPVRTENIAESVTKVRTLIAQGRSVDLGLMQINARNLNWLGLSIEAAFDPCRSIAAGARVLTAFSGYNTGSPNRGFANGYVARVLSANAANQLSPTVSIPAPLSPPVSRTGCAPSWDVWVPCPATAARADPGASDPADADHQARPSAAPILLRGRLAMGADD